MPNQLTNSTIISKNVYQALNLDESINTIQNKVLPECISNISPISTWQVAQIEDIFGKNVHISEQSLYIDNLLHKRDNPNLIFAAIHKKLNENTFFAFKVITSENIKQKLKDNFPPHILNIYYPFHFFFRRVLPKVKGLRKISRLLNMPIDMSKSEVLGRLIYSGFHIVSYHEQNGETVVITKINKELNPSLTKAPPSEGFLFKMSRMGINAKKIAVYKLRSMHPYAEYVQEYIHNRHGLDVGGKFKDDFRVSTGGRVIRKYWIDELPMIYNLIIGDIKLIGVRPISEHYFNLYPDYLKEIRIKAKPGLLPPFYADLPKTFQEIVDSEMKYLTAYQKSPFTTDIKYLMRILNNIFIKKARSQ